MEKFLENYYKSGEHRKPDILVEDIESLTNLEWRKMRQNGIGGSDAGEIMNKNEPTFKTAYDVARSKLDELEDETKSPVDEFRLAYGHALEEPILKWYASTFNAYTFVDRGMYKSPEHPFMLADCDGFAITAEGELIGLEFKTTSIHKMHLWKTGEYGKDGEIGTRIYYDQIQHYMAVMDIDRFDIVACFNNNANDNKVVTVYRDRDYQDELIKAEEYFWNHLTDVGNQLPTFVKKERVNDIVDRLRENKVKLTDASLEAKLADYSKKEKALEQLKQRVNDLEKAMNGDKVAILASIENNKTYQVGEYGVRYKVGEDKATWNSKELDKALKEHPELGVYKNGTRKGTTRLEIWGGKE